MQNFKHTINPADKLFHHDILHKLAVLGFVLPANNRDISSILLKCNIGTRTLKGTITIDKITKKGYSNIKYIGIELNETETDDEED